MITKKIDYIFGNEESLDDIAGLWEKLNDAHLDKSPYFKRFYANNNFKKRKEAFLETARKGKLLVIIASDGDVPVGYCAASLVDGVGEIDSIFVSDNHRERGIGGSLIEKALDWLRQNDSRKLIIKVSAGNEGVFGFYAKYGFLPWQTVLYEIPR